MELEGSCTPAQKKQRTANYTADEKNILFSIVMQHKHVIENKKTDAVTWKEKEAAWQKVATKFNCQSPSGVYRNVASLKKCYENAKKTARKNVAHERMEFVKTGGGKAEAVTVDENDDLILSIINAKTVVGLSNPVDSDMVVECGDGTPQSEDSQVSQSLLAPNFFRRATDIIDQSVPLQIISSCSTTAASATSQGSNDDEGNIDWGDYKAANLKTPLKKTLQVNNSKWASRRRPIATSLQTSELTKTYSDVADLKLEMVSIQLEMLKEEKIAN